MGYAIGFAGLFFLAVVVLLQPSEAVLIPALILGVVVPAVLLVRK